MNSLLITFFIILQVSISGQVERVIDGDTIVVRMGETTETVRYIGVNTPETVHPTKAIEAYGKEASDFNKRLVEGRTVQLVFDVEQRDRYGRLLAYVYLYSLFVNAELVRQGYAQVSTVPPNVKHAELFVRLQREAREANRGLWGLIPQEPVEGPISANTVVYVTRTGTKYHKDGCRYLSQSKIPMTLGEASGRYGPCSVCNPPVLRVQAQPQPQQRSDPTVYVTRTGSKYHKSGCRYLSRSRIPMRLSEAKRRGLTACSVCRPPVFQYFVLTSIHLFYFPLRMTG